VQHARRSERIAQGLALQGYATTEELLGEEHGDLQHLHLVSFREREDRESSDPRSDELSLDSGEIE
jgi:hypothetical protein